MSREGGRRESGDDCFNSTGNNQLPNWSDMPDNRDNRQRGGLGREQAHRLRADERANGRRVIVNFAAGPLSISVPESRRGKERKEGKRRATATAEEKWVECRNRHRERRTEEDNDSDAIKFALGSWSPTELILSL